jgi:hypothetical protein
MSVRVVVRFSPSSLKTNHAGLDLDASATAYRVELERVLRSAIGADAIEVHVDPDASAMRVEIEGAELDRARAVERDVLDHAWVVRQMGSWAVVA